MGNIHLKITVHEILPEQISYLKKKNVAATVVAHPNKNKISLTLLGKLVLNINK